MHLAEDLSARILGRIVDALEADELTGPGGGPMLFSEVEPGGNRGVMRVFTSTAVPKIVSTVLTVPARDVVTCMIFAFTPAASALPHFTLDCSDRPDGHAFHLDLLPRVELASHRAYMDEVFEPLSAAYLDGSGIAGLSPTGTTRRQTAMMSPWMLVHLADESAFKVVGDVVDRYVEHWLSVVSTGLSAEVEASVIGGDLAARDAAVRDNLFSPSIDPVWGRVDAMIGSEAAARIRTELRGVSS